MLQETTSTVMLMYMHLFNCDFNVYLLMHITIKSIVYGYFGPNPLSIDF